MKVLECGHVYELANKLSGSQLLTFFKDLPASQPGHDGVLCQEVIRALIDRMVELYRQAPCQESTEIIQSLRHALVLFETRAARLLLEKSYAKCGLTVEQLHTDERGHVLIFQGSEYADAGKAIGSTARTRRVERASNGATRARSRRRKGRRTDGG